MSLAITGILSPFIRKCGCVHAVTLLTPGGAGRDPAFLAPEVQPTVANVHDDRIAVLDTLVLSHRPKVLMMVDSVTSLTARVVLAARAVNTFR